MKVLQTGTSSQNASAVHADTDFADSLRANFGLKLLGIDCVRRDEPTISDADNPKWMKVLQTGMSCQSSCDVHSDGDFGEATSPSSSSSSSSSKSSLDGKGANPSSLDGNGASASSLEGNGANPN